MPTDTELLCDGQPLLSAKQIAAKLGIGLRTLHRYRSEGVFPQPDVRVGAKIVKWRCSTVDAWIELKQEEGRR